MICFIFLFYSDFSAQGSAVSSTLFMPQGYSLNSLNGFGTSGIYNNRSNLNYINPASLRNYNKPAFGISYEFQTGIEDGWIAKIGGHRIHDLYPGSAGFVYPYKNLRIGLSFGQTYNWQLDFGRIPISTLEQPEGTGKYFEPVYKTRLYSYSLSAALTQDNLFADDNFSIGFRLTSNILKEHEEILSQIGEGSADKISAAVGTIYKYNIDSDRYIEAGISYEMPVELNGEIKIEGSDVIKNVFEGDTNYVVVEKFALAGYVPGKVSLDYSFGLMKSFSILGSINYNYWKSDILTNYEDQLQLAGSLVFGVGSNLKASLGYYKTDFRLKEDYLRINNQLDAFYLTGGLVWSSDMYSIDIALADSHLISGEKRKQTIAKISLGLEI